MEGGRHLSCPHIQKNYFPKIFLNTLFFIIRFFFESLAMVFYQSPGINVKLAYSINLLLTTSMKIEREAMEAKRILNLNLLFYLFFWEKSIYFLSIKIGGNKLKYSDSIIDIIQ